MRALIYVHYDPLAELDPYVTFALARYRSHVDRLVLVSASIDQLPTEARSLVDVFVSRENKGYDFCSWKAGLETISNIEDFDECVFANDSVYGPLNDPGILFDNKSVASADMWGMVLSTQSLDRIEAQGPPHLQSWFFALRRSILVSDAFRAFWNRVVPLESKKEIIAQYEIGMSTHFLNAGFQIAGIFDARVSHRVSSWEILQELSIRHPLLALKFIKKLLRPSYNPSEMRWEHLLAAGVPFLKASLFRVNPYGLRKDRILTDMKRYCDYDTELIGNHLERILR